MVSEDANAEYWNNGYKYGQKITFDNSEQSETLINYTVMIKLDPGNFNYSNCENDGSDIRFIDNDKTTYLNYHFEEWNNVGESIAWVQVPAINGSSSTDYIWLMYGNNDVSDGQDMEATYSNEYSMVYHMADTGGFPFMTRVEDATSNSYDGVYNGGNFSDPGFVGDAIGFDGIDDFVNVSGVVGSEGAYNFSVNVMFKPIGTYTQWMIVMGRGTEGWGNNSIGVNIDDGWVIFALQNETTTKYIGEYTKKYDIGDWVYLSTSFNTTPVSYTHLRAHET